MFAERDILPAGLHDLASYVPAGKKTTDLPVALAIGSVIAYISSSGIVDVYAPAFQRLLIAVVVLVAADAQQRHVIKVHSGLIDAAKQHILFAERDILPAGLHDLADCIQAGCQAADLPVALEISGVIAYIGAGAGVIDVYAPATQRRLRTVVELVAADA